jgi:hypothetical protein
MLKLIKLLVVLGFLVLLLAVGAIVFAFSQLNSIAKTAIEKGGTYAMGVDTKVDSVSVGLLSGKFSLSKLNIANPQGYAAPSFLALGSGSVALDAASLTQPVITLPTFALSDLTLSLERKAGQANYQTILDNLKKAADAISTATGSSSSAPSSGNEKKLVINDLSIRNIQVNVDLLGADGAVGQALNQATRVSIPIDEIKLQNVGKTGTGVGGTGVTVSQLASIIVQAVLGAAADKGAGVLPADLLSDLQGRLASLGDLKSIPTQVLGNAQATVEQLGQQAIQNATNQVGKEAGKALEGLGKGLQNLIPPKPADQPKNP